MWAWRKAMPTLLLYKQLLITLSIVCTIATKDLANGVQTDS